LHIEKNLIYIQNLRQITAESLPDTAFLYGVAEDNLVYMTWGGTMTRWIPYAWPFIISGIMLCALWAAGCSGKTEDKDVTPDLRSGENHRFIVLDPGHFHASLVFKRAAYDNVSPMASVYAPVGEDVIDHLARVEPFNNRPDDPAAWEYRVYMGTDFLDTMLREKPGDVVIISGRNNEKIDRILACVDAGLNVLGDKPLVIAPEKFSILETVLSLAKEKGLVVCDIMTERYEITNILQRLIVNHEPVFGRLTEGTSEEPAVIKSSVHYMSKQVAGKQLKRPWWFFDTTIQGEGLTDITTHLVDLVFWILYPDQAIDYHKEIEMVSARRWPTMLSREQFGTITLKSGFPPELTPDENGLLPCYCNGRMNFRLRGVNVQLEVVWNYEAPEGSGDTHYSVIKGDRAHVLILQGKEQGFRPELYIEPAPGVAKADLEKTLVSFVTSLSGDRYPGLAVVEENGRWRIDIPDRYRVGHEAHFGQVTDRFLAYLGGEPVPDWETANILAKYYVTTRALELSRK